MTPVFNVSLSALTAAGKRIAVSANNVANLRSLGAYTDANGVSNGGFAPKQVQQTSRADGGVVAREVPVDPASVLAFEPNHPDANAEGLVPYPNVDLGEQFVNQILAERAYQASAKVIEAEDRRLETLLSISS